MYAVAYWNSRQSRRAEFVHAGTVRYGAPVDILKAVLIVTTAVRAVHLRGSKCHKNTKLIRTRCVSEARNTQKLVSTGAFPRAPMEELMTLYNPFNPLVGWKRGVPPILLPLSGFSAPPFFASRGPRLAVGYRHFFFYKLSCENSSNSAFRFHSKIRTAFSLELWNPD